MVRVLTLAVALGLLLAQQPVRAGPQPTASEIFHLRTECGKLGDKVANEVNATLNYNKSLHFSKYDEEKNRCYVKVQTFMVDGNYPAIRLYDAQTGRMLAFWALGVEMLDGEVVKFGVLDYIKRTMKDD